MNKSETRKRYIMILEKDETVDDGLILATKEQHLFQLYQDYEQETRFIHNYTADFLRIAN